MKFSRLLFVPAMLMAASAFAANPQVRAEKGYAAQACHDDAITAHCADVHVGHGMLRCIKAFRRANPGYRVSPNCKVAMKQLHADRRAAHQPPPLLPLQP